MKIWIFRIVLLGMLGGLVTGCGSARRTKKRGCPTNSSGMGAERVLAGEKPEKKQKFKVKGMN